MAVLKISKKDLSRSRPEDLSLDSNLNRFKYAEVGTQVADMPAGGGTVTVSIPHILGYPPSFLIYIKGDTGYWAQVMPSATYAFSIPDFHYNGSQWSTDTSLNTRITDTNAGSVAHKIYVRFFLMYDEVE